MPRLSEFITTHRQEILDLWEEFARELPATERMDVAALREHAQAMLEVIVADLETPQSEEQRSRKSRGLEDTSEDAPTAASEHGRGRADRGFSSESMVSEFRALRASVIALWVKHQREAGPSDLEDMRRFNEAIDQALAESLAQFSQDIDTARDRLLAVLGHDLRTPVAAILTSSQVLLEESGLTELQQKLLPVMERSARRMMHLIDDLLALALTRFGSTIPLHRASTDLGVIVREVGDEVNAISPKAQITIDTSGSLVGEWDRRRLGEAFMNLLSNAVAHGTPGSPILVAASGGRDDTVTLEITNAGRAIPREEMSTLFDPMKRTGADRQHLGLGLYIVNRIVEVHGGTIKVRSTEEEGTTFRITLPRHGALKPAER